MCFLLVQDGEPLALLMRGVNLYTGGHFDEYDATFFDYKVQACRCYFACLLSARNNASLSWLYVLHCLLLVNLA